MLKQGNSKSVVHNNPEYADVQMLWWKFYWFYARVLIIFTKLSWKLKPNKSESISQSIPERRAPDRMSKYRERKPPSKGLLARVKCQEINARMSAILSVFSKPCELVSLQESCCVAGSITSQSFPDFLNLAESCREKAVFVQRHNTSFHSRSRQTALKLTPITHKLTLNENRVSLILDTEKF